jgi:hypothetical protein
MRGTVSILASLGLGLAIGMGIGSTPITGVNPERIDPLTVGRYPRFDRWHPAIMDARALPRGYQVVSSTRELPPLGPRGIPVLHTVEDGRGGVHAARLVIDAREFFEIASRGK